MSGSPLSTRRRAAMNATDVHTKTTTVTVPTGPIACEGCRRQIERCLCEDHRVASAHVDAAHGLAHAEVRAGGPTADELAELVACACEIGRASCRERV